MDSLSLGTFLMRRIGALLWFILPSIAWAQGLLIVANPQVPASSISAGELASIYLVQKTAWAGGLPIVPVNRDSTSSIREHFSETVLEHSPRELAEYWNRLRFQGRLPPIVQASDQAVVGFIRNVPGAVGYISADQSPTGVKILARLP